MNKITAQAIEFSFSVLIYVHIYKVTFSMPKHHINVYMIKSLQKIHYRSLVKPVSYMPSQKFLEYTWLA